jgi:hypothetical protein
VVNNGTFNVTAGAKNSGVVSGGGVTHVMPDAQLTADSIVNGALQIDDGASVTIRANGTNSTGSQVSGLTLAGTPSAWTGHLEINNNVFVLESSTASKTAASSTTRNQVTYGTSNPTGGITSGTVNADPAHKIIDVVDNALLGLTSIAGIALSANSIIVEATYQGDANLDRKVDVTDLGVLATNYGHAVSNGVLQGDFNNDGKVDVTDLGILATNYGLGTTGKGFSTGAVPEPGSLAALLIGSIILVHRRRR